MVAVFWTWPSWMARRARRALRIPRVDAATVTNIYQHLYTVIYMTICIKLFQGSKLFMCMYIYIWVWVNTYFYTIFSGLFTSINPCYFDVNKKGVLLVLTHCHMTIWLVVSNMNFIFHFIKKGWNNPSHWLSLHHFSRWWNCTTNQLSMWHFLGSSQFWSRSGRPR